MIEKLTDHAKHNMHCTTDKPCAECQEIIEKLTPKPKKKSNKKHKCQRCGCGIKVMGYCKACGKKERRDV